MMGGLALIVVLVAYQFRGRRPLLTIHTVLTSSIPVAGVGVALFAAAASVAATALTANVLLQTYSPVRVGLLLPADLLSGLEVDAIDQELVGLHGVQHARFVVRESRVGDQVHALHGGPRIWPAPEWPTC